MTDAEVSNAPHPRIAPGDVVSGLVPDELVEIRRLAPFGAKTKVEGVGLESRRLITLPLTATAMAALRKVRGDHHTFQGDPARFLLGAEAERIRVAHQFDPLFAVNSSIVDPLPHQVEAVYRYLLPLPRIRFLLGDDTGAGKTIMAGLLIKELLYRGVIRKILIITPGGLTIQWKEEELQEKFGLHSRLVNRASFNAEPGQFSRHPDGIFVTSIDFLARNDSCRNAAAATQWDLIIVDEAHKLSAYEYGSKLDESQRYQAVKALAKQTDHLLFLTATPHSGRKDTFRRLLLLLDEDLFQKDAHVSDRVRGQSPPQEDFEDEQPISRARNRFFLRRLKEEMVDWENRPLFKPRHTKTVGYDLTPEEKTLYDKVTRYLRSKRKEAKNKRNRNVELTLMVMQRRQASSLYAITRTLKNRLNALNEVLSILTDPNRTDAEKKRLLQGDPDPADPRDLAEYEDLTEAERARVDDRIFRQVLTADPDKVEEERDEVAELFRFADDLKHHKEAKFAELLRVLDSSDVMRADDEKLLIFTEHKDTLDSLTRRLEEKGYTVVNIHGGMDVDRRKKAQRDFRTRAKIMVATDAAGEGINLQFCRYLINWDIPWNPTRLEQRMGRVHRYGQKDDVWVYNLVAQNTREGMVLERVLSKLDVMREQMGSDRVYDVIDQWLADVPLVKLIQTALDADDETHAGKKAAAALDKATRDRARELVDVQKKTSLTSSLDLRAARDLRDASDEHRFQPHFINRFFESAWTACGGTIRVGDHFPVWHLGPTPAPLLEIAREKRLFPSDGEGTPFVFDKAWVSVASRVPVPEGTRLMGPGHPIFDALIHWAIRESRRAFAQGALITDPNIAAPQQLWLIRSTIQDGRPDRNQTPAHERLVAVIQDHLGLRATSPSCLLNCVPPETPIDPPDLPERSVEDIQAWAFEEITEKQLARVTRTRAEESDLRREYLETAFTDLILELETELSDLQQAQLFGEQNQEDQDRLHQRIRELRERKANRLRELDLLTDLKPDIPEVITSAAVVPVPKVTIEDEADFPAGGVPMRRDDVVEAVAMNVAMSHERGRGWIPTDVSLDGEHYDIRSQGPHGEKRFIEVKGRAKTGDIILTGPELDKLSQLGDRAWLYIVTFCKGDRPVLRIIQNPISKLSPEMLYRQIQFRVDETDWSSHGEEVKEKETP